LSIPVYCYENAAFIDERKNLANCRAGEYEGLPKKLSDARWKPDFGTATFNKRAGATVVGARDFLVAYNVNLDKKASVDMAKAIARDVRETTGSLKAVKAIGWFIEEYECAQVSMNLTDISITPVHVAFDEVCKKAEERGVKITGSELVGLISLKSLLDAGRYFRKNKQKHSDKVSDDELIKVAVESLGLNDVKSFNPDEKIIEYAMAKKGNMSNLYKLQ
jgi:glutamate formiminotransferase/formiminotetrahydrofolate cyclodeaminase